MNLERYDRLRSRANSALLRAEPKQMAASAPNKRGCNLQGAIAWTWGQNVRYLRLAEASTTRVRQASTLTLPLAGNQAAAQRGGAADVETAKLRLGVVRVTFWTPKIMRCFKSVIVSFMTITSLNFAKTMMQLATLLSLCM